MMMNFLQSTATIVLLTVMVVLLALPSEVAATSTCGSYCLRVSSISLSHTPPYLTAMVAVTGSNLGRMRGSIVTGEFKTPNDKRTSASGWVGTRDASIRMALPSDGVLSGTYSFTVTNVTMRGDANFIFDPEGSTVLASTITIP